MGTYAKLSKDTDTEYNLFLYSCHLQTAKNSGDFRRHMNYLHFDPVKHGLVKCVKYWPYSTFHQFVKNGFSPQDWGGDEMGEITNADFGE